VDIVRETEKLGLSQLAILYDNCHILVQNTQSWRFQ
jgi:hypothetical protein